MALNPVSLTEALRPWHLAGISAFVFDEQAIKDILAPTRPTPQRRSAPAATPTGPSAQRRTATAPASAAAGIDNHRRPSPPTVTSLPHNSAAPERPSRAAAHPDHAPTSPGADALPDPTRWPAPWSALWAKTPTAPLVWTYAELGADLSGQGDKARSACLRELIGSLGLPRGSSAFWPISLPGTQDSPSTSTSQNLPQESCFLQGIRLLRPHGIIVFGSRALAQSGLETTLPTPFSQTLRNGVLHLLLPDLATILASASDFSKTAAYLRASLSTLPALFSR